MTIPTTTHPYRVGRVVYRTIEDATAALDRASEDYPDAKVCIVDRATEQVVHARGPVAR